VGKANQVDLQFMFYVGDECYKSTLTGIDLRGPFKSGQYCRILVPHEGSSVVVRTLIMTIGSGTDPGTS
jgi:hypothetical protein